MDSPDSSPYDILLNSPQPSPRNPFFIAKDWIHTRNADFGGDIKIVERVVDDAPETPEDLPEYIGDRYLSIFYREGNSAGPVTSESPELQVLNSPYEFYPAGKVLGLRTKTQGFKESWGAVDRFWTHLTAAGLAPVEIRATFHCIQSPLESRILRQILMQEFSGIPDVLIVTGADFCMVRTFGKFFASLSRKKFGRSLESAYELTELAAKVHHVALQICDDRHPAKMTEALDKTYCEVARVIEDEDPDGDNDDE